MSEGVPQSPKNSIGRGAFAIIFCVVVVAIYLLPGAVRVVIASNLRLSPDPGLGIVAMMLIPSDTTLCLLALFSGLGWATLLRLRDVGLSGALVWIFPFMALPSLTSFVSAQLDPLAFGIFPHANPLLRADVILALLLGAALAIAPGRNAGVRRASLAIGSVRQWTTCDGTIGRSEFRRKTGLALALLGFVVACSWVWLPSTPTGLTTSWLFAPLTVFQLALLVVLISHSARRLHDVGMSSLAAGILPAAYFGLVAFGVAPSLMLCVPWLQAPVRAAILPLPIALGDPMHPAGQMMSSPLIMLLALPTYQIVLYVLAALLLVCLAIAPGRTHPTSGRFANHASVTS